MKYFALAILHFLVWELASSQPPAEPELKATVFQNTTEPYLNSLSVPPNSFVSRNTALQRLVLENISNLGHTMATDGHIMLVAAVGDDTHPGNLPDPDCP